MVNLDDCKSPDGSTDWKKYNELQQRDRQERKAKGELCHRCGGFLLWPKGTPQSCQNCTNIDKAEELRHPSDVRCPGCGFHWRVGDGDYYELYEEGSHQVGCPRCDLAFEVNTVVSHTFISPERVMKPKGDES